MSCIVVANRRYSIYNRSNNAKAWKVIAEYQGKDIAPKSIIPDWLKHRWLKNKSVLGYATYQGFSSGEALLTIALAKTGAVSLYINRWGQISSYKIR